MLRDNLKAAISKSGLIVKEIAAKSEVKKRTIDKWVGISATEPKVNDLYKVCKVLSVTMEWVVDGEAGSEYVRTIVRSNPSSVRAPKGT
jgi:transcriptional regulator with XRE-family HTH domain